MSTTGTLLTTNISPSIPFVNRELRAIAATYEESSTPGTYILDMTKNFLYGMIFDDMTKSATTNEKIEIPLRGMQGIVKRFIDGEKTGGSITLNFGADPQTYIPYKIPPHSTSGGLIMEPHFCLWLGFTKEDDPTKFVPFLECPINIESYEDLNFPKNQAATGSIVFYQTGEGLRIGISNINKVLDYLAPTGL